uniref:Anaphase-promoting complex subunit CDC26 n=1 Tax=Culex tarsalis TaxID=7177 RepID=A0A1Q3FU32_CULTA
MRRREIRNFTIKLSDLKEYEQAKQERLAKASEDHSTGSGAGGGGDDSAGDADPLKSPEVTVTPLPKVGGAKTKQEIRARIGYQLELP